MTWVAELRARAAALHRRIVFPECADDRTRRAIAVLAAQRIVEPVAVLDPSSPDSHGAVRALGVEVRDAGADPHADETAAALLRQRRTKGMDDAQAATLA